jgi:hypothetical protein
MIEEGDNEQGSLSPSWWYKMYRDVKGLYWWNNMKQDIARFVEQCSTCQQVKIEHQRPVGTIKLLLVPKWK